MDSESDEGVQVRHLEELQMASLQTSPPRRPRRLPRPLLLFISHLHGSETLQHLATKKSPHFYSLSTESVVILTKFDLHI